jgi:tetratricopeptide (TPR) repeat protein
MWRPILAKPWPLLLLAALINPAQGDDQTWLGREVMTRSVHTQPRARNRVTRRPIACVRTLKRAKGNWLWLDDGWLRTNEVVPLSEAEAWFTTRIDQRPTAFDYVSRAAVYCTTGDYQAAEADCAAALRISPRYDAAYYYQAATRAAQGQFTEAVAAYTAALRLNPRLMGAYLDRGAARLKLSDYSGALADVNHALRLSPREPDGYYVRGVARYHLHDYRKALNDLNYVVRANPARAAAYDLRGACQQQLGQLDAALADFDKAIELEPSNSSASAHRDNLRLTR